MNGANSAAQSGRTGLRESKSIGQMNVMTETPASSAVRDDEPHTDVAPPLRSASATSGVLAPELPRVDSPILKRVGRWLLARAGWRFEGEWPDTPKVVIIVAPHTSNWDFPVGLAAKWALELRAHWWGKDALFRPPLGWFMRLNGGIPVARVHRENAVADTIRAFATHDRFAFALAPEGTRKKVAQWRSGFWHVARGAKVPIVCVAFDWQRHVIRIGPTTFATEPDAAAGIARIRSYFEGIRGYDPTRQ
jgi:hypothetical protein